LTEQAQKLQVAEMKFRDMISDLMAMEKPRMIIEVGTSSKARKLRRNFYNYAARLYPYEKRFADTLVFRLSAGRIIVERRIDWTPKEASLSGDPNVRSESTGDSAGGNRLDNGG
jgi:hypothetical protein